MAENVSEKIWLLLDPLIYINFHDLLWLSAGSGEVGDDCTIMPTESGASQLASEYLIVLFSPYSAIQPGRVCE